MQEEWPSCSEAKKADIMKALGKRWKEFKSALHRQYILGQSDEDPRAKWHIPPHVWDEFVRHCSSPEFQVVLLIICNAN